MPSYNLITFHESLNYESQEASHHISPYLTSEIEHSNGCRWWCHQSSPGGGGGGGGQPFMTVMVIGWESTEHH